MNVLVFVHGMTPDVAPSDPRSPGGTYDKFWRALQAHKPELKNMFPDGPILVEWGHQLSPAENPVREDHRITEVERFVNDRMAYHNIKEHPGANNVLTGDWGIPGVRQLVTSVREGVFSLASQTWFTTVPAMEKSTSVLKFTIRYWLPCNHT